MKRAHWTSRIGFILASAGSAIGLGNIWRFPYLAGANGGGSFLILYLLCVCVLGYFLVLGKLAFGRAAATNIVDGFQGVAKQNGKSISRFWGYAGGGLTVLNGILVSSVYVIVIGWTLLYLAQSFLSLVDGGQSAVTADYFNHLTQSLSRQLFWGAICILITGGVIAKGVRNGIERLAGILMPVLFGLLVFILIRILILPEAWKGALFLFTPDFSLLGFHPDGFNYRQFSHLLLTALGQSVYSLSLGIGVIYIYGSYLTRSVNLVYSTGWIVALDVFVSILAGLIVLPAVFAFGMEPASGPTLSFITLPLIFEQLWGGSFLFFIFCVLLFIAALTSLVSIYEPLVNLVTEKTKLKRLSATLLICLMNFCGTFIVLTSFTDTFEIRLWEQDLFSFLDALTGTVLMPVMVLICCLFIGWVVPDMVIRQITPYEGQHAKLSFFARYFRWTLRITAPFVLIILLITALFS